MSWALTYSEGVRGSHAEEDLNAKTLAEGVDYGDSSEAVLEQVNNAKVTAFNLINWGSIGNKDKIFYVILSGHANPNHEPKEGWANDSITVSVSQK